MQKVDLSLQLRATNYDDNEDMTTDDWVGVLLTLFEKGAKDTNLEFAVSYIQVDFDSINKAG